MNYHARNNGWDGGSSTVSHLFSPSDITSVEELEMETERTCLISIASNRRCPWLEDLLMVQTSEDLGRYNRDRRWYLNCAKITSWSWVAYLLSYIVSQLNVRGKIGFTNYHLIISFLSIYTALDALPCRVLFSCQGRILCSTFLANYIICY
jgi:hypothetical protein